MLTLKFRHTAKSRLSGNKDKAIVGVVTSGNLEVLLERMLPGTACEVDIATPFRGYDATWKAVITEFIKRSSPGGLRISIDDTGGAAGCRLPAPNAGQRADGGRMMEDAERPVGFRRPHANAWRACWTRIASRSSRDRPSASRARTFICSTCLRLLTTGLSSAAANWMERMYGFQHPIDARPADAERLGNIRGPLPLCKVRKISTPLRSSDRVTVESDGLAIHRRVGSNFGRNFRRARHREGLSR
jgi:malonate decarboxylase delta subunit